jgi:RNA polymerase sigma factor (sigma-70 family)
VRTDSALGSGQSDGSIIERSVKDPQAFSVLFERHFDDIHRYLARRIGSDRADDLAADVFVVAFERRATFRTPADVRPWLFGIATNLLRNDSRAERRALTALADLTAAAGDSGAGVVGVQRTEVLEALAALDTDQRDVVLLFAWEGLSYEEIGSALGVPVGTVRSPLARARRRLRKQLAHPTPVAGSDQREVNE